MHAHEHTENFTIAHAVLQLETNGMILTMRKRDFPFARPIDLFFTTMVSRASLEQSALYGLSISRFPDTIFPQGEFRSRKFLHSKLYTIILTQLIPPQP